jgi:PncC family amidohydrolase
MNKQKGYEYDVYDLLKKYNLSITTAESATGGLVAATLINVPGISEYIKEAYITYSDDAKVKLLGLDKALIGTYGVVSLPVAVAMAEGARRVAGTDIAVSVTGIAGPDGGTAECPVGTVWIGYTDDAVADAVCFRFTGDRNEVRSQAATETFKLIISHIKERYDI